MCYYVNEMKRIDNDTSRQMIVSFFSWNKNFEATRHIKLVFIDGEIIEVLNSCVSAIGTLVPDEVTMKKYATLMKLF